MDGPLFETIYLLIFGKKSHLYVYSNTFINFFTFTVKCIKKRLYFFQTTIIICNGSQGGPSTWNYDQNSSRIHENCCYYWFSLTKSLQEFPPMCLFRPILLLFFEKISHLYFYSVLYVY